MMIAILKYNAGNTQSVENAVKRLGYECVVTDDRQLLQSAEKVIFPGVGEAASAMEYLRGKNLDEVVKSLTQPVLGICLGLQLMCRYSEEGDTNGLGIFDVDVKKFPPKDKVPHMGWNTISKSENQLFNRLLPDDNVYFVHSYYAELSQFTIAECDYILPFSAALQKNNFYAVQFHTEKSGTVGEQILTNFLKL
ncbi:imidazole glycerol phosphate synthase subunit HisH [Flavobacterium zepuense]|uniref:Imidazole glycerol phosphate synthase subunit HisH n=2 Tax=Flavobacterium zepuense TaxID=2593302 RepID=A0A552VA18_9FLAO|nr:imidazole glycerol phosphate synthase subunit HisH [Flavobacterium zepuense]